MACKIVWSPASRDDLRDIVRFIARDNPRRAESFAYQLMAQADILQEHPEIGRPVPERRDPKIRELIFSPYRIVYRFRSGTEIGRDLARLARRARHSRHLTRPAFPCRP
jgi:toxin ParE1/3/4